MILFLKRSVWTTFPRFPVFPFTLTFSRRNCSKFPESKIPSSTGWVRSKLNFQVDFLGFLSFFGAILKACRAMRAHCILITLWGKHGRDYCVLFIKLRNWGLERAHDCSLCIPPGNSRARTPTHFLTKSYACLRKWNCLDIKYPLQCKILRMMIEVKDEFPHRYYIPKTHAGLYMRSTGASWLWGMKFFF